MPRHRRNVSRPNDRRITRRRDAELPDVPVSAAGSSAPPVTEGASDKPNAAAQPDSMDDRIRRMIEAAYT
jgi:hypothetical protein